MKVKNLVVVFTLVSCPLLCSSQTDNKKKTNVNTDVDITVVYEQVVKEGYGTPFIYLELATSYYFKSNYEKARHWYEKLFEFEKPRDETLKFRYKQTLKALNITKNPNGDIVAFEEPD